MDDWDAFFAALTRWRSRLLLGSFIVAILILWMLVAVAA